MRETDTVALPVPVKFVYLLEVAENSVTQSLNLKITFSMIDNIQYY